MKKKIIYAKSYDGINRCVCYIDDEKIKGLYNECLNYNYEVLSCLTKLLLETKSSLHLSYTINNLINYDPLDDKQCDLHSKIISSISIEKENKKIDFMKYLVNYYSNNILDSPLNFMDEQELTNKTTLPYIYK